MGKSSISMCHFPQIHGLTLWYIHIDPGRQGLEDSCPLKNNDFQGLC